MKFTIHAETRKYADNYLKSKRFCSTGIIIRASRQSSGRTDREKLASASSDTNRWLLLGGRRLCRRQFCTPLSLVDRIFMQHYTLRTHNSTQPPTKRRSERKNSNENNNLQLLCSRISFFSSSLSFFHTRAHFGVRSILRVRLNCFKWSFNLVFCWERERPKYSNINICVIPTWRSQIWKWLHHFVRDTILRAFTHTHTLEPTINTKRSAAISERWAKNEEKNVFRYWRAAIGMISFLVDVVAVILWIRKSVGTIFVRPAKLAVFRIRIFLLYNT